MKHWVAGDRSDLYVGRAGEMRQLATAIERVRDGRGQVVLVSGPAGIGKTRFCEENALLAQEAGFAVAWGRCWSDGGAPALWPWQSVLSQLCGLETAALLDQESGPDAVDPERFSRFVAVVDQLCGTRRPTVGSDTGAVPGLPRVRFPCPPAEPDVRLSPHPALHVSFPLLSRSRRLGSRGSVCSLRGSGSGSPRRWRRR